MRSTLAGLAVVAGLVAATAFLVAVEFSMVAARRSRLSEMAAGGDRGAQRALVARRQLQLVLSAVQLGITVVSLLLGLVARGTIGAALEPVAALAGLSAGATAALAVGAGFVVATAAQMVLGELVPKNLATARPEQVASRLGRATLVYMAVAGPVTRAFDSVAEAIVRAAGVESHGDHQDVSASDLDVIVAESARHGELSAQQAELLMRGVEFDQLVAAEVMVPWNRTVRIWYGQSCEGLRGVLTSGHTRFPVVGTGGTVVGVVHAKDLLGVDEADWARRQVREVAREALVVPESCRAANVLAAMRDQATELAVVTDEFGAPAGIVTLEDLLEELVGEIDDEFDDGPSLAHQVCDDGSVLVPGQWRVDEVGRNCGIELPDGEAWSTVGGLVHHAAQRVVGVGDTVVVDGRVVEVTAVDGWAVVEVRIHPGGGDATVGHDEAGRDEAGHGGADRVADGRGGADRGADGHGNAGNGTDGNGTDGVDVGPEDGR